MKKIISVFMASVLSIVFFPCLIHAEADFTDLSKEHWAYEYISSMANSGVVNGYPDGTFKPENYVTRAEFCAMTTLTKDIFLGEISGYNQWKYTYNNINHWANEYMESMFYNTRSYGEWYLLNNVEPDSYVNRSEVAMGLFEIASELPKSTAGFEDKVSQALSEKYSDYSLFGGHTAAIYFADQMGFINGYPDGTFKPSNLVTRAELCTMLHRLSLSKKDSSTDNSVVDIQQNLDNQQNSDSNQSYNNDIVKPNISQPNIGYGEIYTAKHKIKYTSFPLYLYAQDGTFLGNINSNQFDTDSIANEFGKYGSEFQTKSIFNEFGTYGSKFSQYSPFNEFASKPPKILDKNGQIVGYLTANRFSPMAVSYEEMMVLLRKFNK